MARQKEFDLEEVLDKAVALFRQRGYAATGVEDLVSYLGIGRGSLYATFGSKHGLYLAALDPLPGAECTGAVRREHGAAGPRGYRPDSGAAD